MSIKRFITKWKGQEKRVFPRIECPSTKRPMLKVGKHEMEVINISDRGLKFLHDKQVLITRGKWIHGKIVFLNGTIIDITGQVIWKESNQVGLLLSGRIPSSIIEGQITLYTESDQKTIEPIKDSLSDYSKSSKEMTIE